MFTPTVTSLANPIQSDKPEAKAATNSRKMDEKEKGADPHVVLGICVNSDLLKYLCPTDWSRLSRMSQYMRAEVRNDPYFKVSAKVALQTRNEKIKFFRSESGAIRKFKNEFRDGTNRFPHTILSSAPPRYSAR